MLRCGLKMKTGFVLALIPLWLGTFAVAGGSHQMPTEPIKWSVKAAQQDHALKPGAKFALELTARIEDGWHLYSLEQAEGGPIPTRITVPADQPFTLSGVIESPEPKSALDPNFNLITPYYEEQAVFTIPLKVADHAADGRLEVRVNVSFQTCSNDLCLPPKTVKLGAAVDIAR